jgi:HhH-GPD superfamily base excision DNA repair protein.
MDRMENMKLMDIYNRLYNNFGPRHWWPAKDDFEMIIGAILTQNVAWKNVEVAIENLYSRDLIDLYRLYNAKDEEIIDAIRPARFFNQKLRYIKAFCKHIIDEYGGELDKFFDKDTKTLRRELLSLPGIGEETADVIILYGARKPIFVVDAYTKRLVSLLGIMDGPFTYPRVQQYFMSNLETDLYLFNEYHALIDAWGNIICRGKAAKCAECPLSDLCSICTLDRTKDRIAPVI